MVRSLFIRDTSPLEQGLKHTAIGSPHSAYQYSVDNSIRIRIETLEQRALSDDVYNSRVIHCENPLEQGLKQ